LLDWLALRFVESGWSLKALHRLIVSSEAYQRASAGQDPWPDDERARLRRIDPDNRLLASFPLRRLDFEQLRDAQLAVTGELESRIGGSPSGLLEPSNQRRSVYGLVDRQFLPGVLRTFDFANPDLHVAVRHETTVPQQGLFFLNGPFAANRARMLARAVSGLSPEDRIHARVLGRAMKLATHNPETSLRQMRTELDAEPGVVVDYVAAVNPTTFAPVTTTAELAPSNDVTYIVAAKVGSTRLLDTVDVFSQK
jgi:hypothetical protein